MSNSTSFWMRIILWMLSAGKMIRFGGGLRWNILTIDDGKSLPSETTAPTEEPATEPPAPEFTAPEGALVAFPANAAPTLDGVADDAAWADAQEVVIRV